MIEPRGPLPNLNGFHNPCGLTRYEMDIEVHQQNGNPEFTAAELVSFLSTQTRRSLLTSHLLVAFDNEPDSLAPLKLEEDVIAKTVRQYSNLLEWTESSAAAVLALQNGVSVATIHNRLRIAREKGILEKPGSGKRTL